MLLLKYMVRKIDPEGIYELATIAEIFGVNKRTIVRRSKRNELPEGRKIGRKRYFIGQEILNSLASPSTRVNLVTKEELEKKKK